MDSLVIGHVVFPGIRGREAAVWVEKQQMGGRVLELDLQQRKGSARRLAWSLEQRGLGSCAKARLMRGEKASFCG